MSESALQKKCVQWFRLKFPKILIYSHPNEAKRSYALASHLKAMGMTSGVPDLFIASPRGGYGGLYIELKFGKNKLTPNQVEITEILRNAGYRVEHCWTFEEFAVVAQIYLSLCLNSQTLLPLLSTQIS